MYNIFDRQENLLIYALAFNGFGNFFGGFDFAGGLDFTGDVYEFNSLPGEAAEFLIFFELGNCEVVFVDADYGDFMFCEKFLPVELYLLGIFPEFCDVDEFDVFIDAVFGAFDVAEVGEEISFRFCLKNESGGAGEVG